MLAVKTKKILQLTMGRKAPKTQVTKGQPKKTKVKTVKEHPRQHEKVLQNVDIPQTQGRSPEEQKRGLKDA